MSIFGFKRKNILNGQINSLISRQLDLVKTEQSAFYSTVSTLNTKIDKLENKRIITIFAESSGALTVDEMFSFGNGGKERDVGYTMCFPGKIISMGLSTKGSAKKCFCFASSEWEGERSWTCRISP